jgi:hypothetical protein
VLVVAPLDEACPSIVDQERKEQSCHEDCCSSTFILELTQALVAEHQFCVSEEMDKGGRNDNAGAELLQNDEDDVLLRDQVEASSKNGHEDSKCARCEDDEEETNP